MDVDPEPIEAAAEEVVQALEVPNGPVDPFAIAEQEGIRLAPGNYDGCFDSRIEYHKKNAVGRFILFYGEEDGPWRPEGRVRFSIGHELGHYYLAAHREFVLTGVWHDSHTGFVSDQKTEREADLFAAALLMPRTRFIEEVQLRCGGKCAMKDLERLASNVFRTSLTSTAIRYVQMDREPCAVIVSANGRVKSAIISQSMRSRGLTYIPRGSAVPSVTAATQVSDSRRVAMGSQSSDVWFPEKQRAVPLWEEARQLGGTKLILTLLAFDGDKEEDEDEPEEDRDN
jgi:hypothetical protein